MDLIAEIFFGLLSGLLRKFAEWIDPALPPTELSRDPVHEKRLGEMIERNPRYSDPVYKKNLRRLIERSRQFEEARKPKEELNDANS